MNRHAKHIAARESVRQHLQRMGLVSTEAPQNSTFDLLVNGRTRIALRVAYPGSYTHTVTVSGKRYAYDYRSWNFNFHRHGRWNRRDCDIYVCIAKHRRAADEVFVIPSSAISGPTFSLHGSGKPYRGRYAKFRDRWVVIAEHAAELSAAAVA